MRSFLLLLCVALTVGCTGTVVAQQVEAQPGSPAKQQPPAAATGGQPKEVVNTIGMKLMLIPAGTFTMGSPIEEEGANDNEEQHQVTISKDYYLGVTEVTQGQYEKVMGTNPSNFQKRVIRKSDSSMYP
ncbi:MAG: formylglycine-generating enzyme family protein, partial [Planctomycetaceae bacterium]